MTRRARDQYEVWERAFRSHDHQPLLDAMGTSLSDDTLKLALTHRSFANEHGFLPNNERLEFVGDAILGLVVGHELYTMHPTRPEHDISKMRASVVSRYGLSDVARGIGLGSHILLGKGEKRSNGADKDTILADTTEAILGAIFLENGYEEARRVILSVFRTKIDQALTVGMHEDWKTTLQEKAAEKKLEPPQYHATCSGPPHAPTFSVVAVVGGKIVGSGSGRKKTFAEQDAAKEACALLANGYEQADVFDEERWRASQPTAISQEAGCLNFPK